MLPLLLPPSFDIVTPPLFSSQQGKFALTALLLLVPSVSASATTSAASPSVCASTPPLLSPTPVCSIVTAPLSLCCAVAATTPHCLHRSITTASALISNACTPPLFTLPSVTARTPLLLLLPLFYAGTQPLPSVSAELQLLLLLFSSVHAAATPLISLPVPQFSCSPQCMLVHHHCCCSLLCIEEQVHHYYCSRHPCSQE
jgi:hypothetical protein